MSRKRLFSSINIWDEMIRASSVRNYMLDDPLIDYLQEYNIKSINSVPRKSRYINQTHDNFTNFLLEEGIKFEEKVMNDIKKNHNVVTVCLSHRESKNSEKFNETVNLMKKGVDIIYQGVLHNYNNKTFGVPDLIVRSDYINKLFNNNLIDKEEEKIKSDKLGINFHYKIVDIKHCTIPFRKDNKHILNESSVPAFKGQLYIYTKALNEILGINTNKAYIYGKNSESGIIDYDTVDKIFVEKTEQAILWLRDMKTNGSEWELNPPSREELYPNMKNTHDGFYRKIKNDINSKVNDITSIWWCGVKKRKTAHLNNVYDWKNPLCNSSIMGFGLKDSRASIVNKILDINRNENEIINPKIINYDRQKWKYKDDKLLEIYIDFETITNFIFLIGIGYEKDNIWYYQYFLLEDKTLQSEINMFNKFIEYINNLLILENKEKARFYHWFHVEKTGYDKFKNKHLNLKFQDLEFYDLLTIFNNEPIVIKGALNFKLKDIAKAMYSHKLINTTWSDKINDGLSVMVDAEKYYNNNMNKQIFFRDIIKYNEIDCKVLWEMHNYIRNNH